MSVRKRTWKTPKGETKEAWIVDYVDQHGDRHIKTFPRKKEADAHHAMVNVEVSQGIHTANSTSITIAEAGARWLAACDAADPPLERTTLHDYAVTLKLHITPHLGGVKLSRLTVPMVGEFRTKLREGGMSPPMVKKVLTALGSIVREAQESGLVAQNVVRSVTGRKKTQRKAEQKRKLRAGVDFPMPDEARTIIGKLHGRWRPLLLTAIFCGLRSSKLRGLRWQDIDFNAGELHVRQRADRYHAIGAPKSEAGERTVPIPVPVLNALREWKLKCPKGELDLAFPNVKGNIESRGNIITRGLIPIEIKAGVTVAAVDKEGKPTLSAKYTGLHAFRHFLRHCASTGRRMAAWNCRRRSSRNAWGTRTLG